MERGVNGCVLIRPLGDQKSRSTGGGGIEMVQKLPPCSILHAACFLGIKIWPWNFLDTLNSDHGPWDCSETLSMFLMSCKFT